MRHSTEVGAADFLDLIHGPGAAIYFQVGGKTWKNRPQPFASAKAKLEWRNAEGDSIGFIVNAGGSKDKDITRINSCFVDWDAGRGDDGRYREAQEVTTAKATWRRVLESFPLPPSVLVETRNGYHAYWLLHSGVSSEQFRDCQRRLADQLDTDPVTVNPARVMRLPGYDWTKPGHERFPVRVVSVKDKRFRIEELFGALQTPKTNEGTIRHHNKCGGSSSTALIVVSNPDADEIVVSSMEEAIAYLKTRDLRQYLGVGSSGPFHCPYHNDRSPSASIGRDEGSGHWLFCCHSSRCGVNGSIIDLAMQELSTSDAGAALKVLMKRFNIVVDTGWKQKEAAILDANIGVLSDPDTLSSLYPYLYRWIGRVRNDLMMRLHWAKGCIRTERLQVEGRHIFFLSLREMERRAKDRRELPVHFGCHSQRVDRYCLLGLMKKVPDADIPDDVLADARERQGRRAHRIQFYSFPEYTPTLLSAANQRARSLVDAGVSVRGVSRQLIMDLFGEQVGAEVYPQRADTPGTAACEFAAAVEAHVIADIKTLRYTTASRVRKALKGHSQSLTHRRVERVLPGICQKNSLIRVVANQQMKDRLGLAARGFPKVIVPANAAACRHKHVDAGRRQAACRHDGRSHSLQD
jgi:hypothetical protein